MLPLLDRYELAQLLSLTSRQVLRMVKSDGLPTVRLMKDEIRFDREEVEAWLKARKECEAEIK